VQGTVLEAVLLLRSLVLLGSAGAVLVRNSGADLKLC